jgi:phenylacetate-CoA ligase
MIKRWILDILMNIRRTNSKMEYFEIRNLIKEKRLVEFQKESLRNLILHAYKNVPYYTQIFNKVNIVKNSNIADLSRFSKIPILTKDIIRNNQESLVSKDYKQRRWYHNSSGGSTGEPLRFIQDNTYEKWCKASTRYFGVIIGINTNNNPKNISLWGSDIDILKNSTDIKESVQNFLTNTKLLNCFKMNEDNIKKYIKTINSFKPEYIVGYAGSLYELCRFAEKEQLKLITPNIIISAAETLRDDMRQKIEEVFGTKVFDFYGSREAASLAGECKYGSIHIFSYNNLIEILDEDNQPVKKNEEGRVIITNLHNYSMPLIRYEIGDMAVLGDKRCKCGSPLPTLEKLAGRIIEHFIKEDGEVVPGEFFIYLFIVYYNKGIVKQFQVIQEEYKRIKILIVPFGNINEPERKDIEDKIKVVMGKDIKIIWEFVDDIPKTKSGKYIYIRSLVKRQK